ncbi:helix-turn-helix domain-containing protein [Nonomuraea sp. NPDC050556]|uniref:helix-turn-helix domain-containing protein n=1 Tax=Nonomuraea sp. NPDC050556 TaxID=3364369 RepID=UPI00378EEE4B
MPSSAQQARRAFGNRLREIRLDAGLSGRELAAAIGIHFTKVSRAEHGNQVPTDGELRAWCEVCGVADQAASLITQARAADSLYREWRKQARAGLRRLQEDIGPLYERTLLFRVHEHWSIPGLLQTARYSLESMAYWAQLLDLPDDREAATEARLARQRVLQDGKHRFTFLLAEQALRTRVGSVEIMAEQLDHVLAAMSLPNVWIGIIPAGAGLGAHTQTAFWIFDDQLVKVETLTAALDIIRAEEIQIYLAVFEQMRRAAEFEEGARRLIIRARDELLQ